MSGFVLIPGAGGLAWYWSRVVPLLQHAGHAAVSVDLPGDDPNAGLPEYADLVAAAVRDVQGRTGVDGTVLVAQSLGGFTAPMACARAPVTQVVLVNAMVPRLGETPGEWWGHVGAVEARQEAARHAGHPPEFDLETYFLHDVPADVVAEGADQQRPEVDAVFASVCDVAWPDLPTRVLVGADDRFFPAAFQVSVARERLGVDADLISGGHLVALANPAGLVDYLLS